jgi:hypothetical protein
VNIGTKMAFILRVYQMTEAKNAEDIEHDWMMLYAGTLTEREFWKRASTRSVARRLRHRDDAGNWPRDPNYRVGRTEEAGVEFARCNAAETPSRRRENAERQPVRTGALLIPFPSVPTAGNPEN